MIRKLFKEDNRWKKELVMILKLLKEDKCNLCVLLMAWQCKEPGR